MVLNFCVIMEENKFYLFGPEFQDLKLGSGIRGPKPIDSGADGSDRTRTGENEKSGISLDQEQLIFKKFGPTRTRVEKCQNCRIS